MNTHEAPRPEIGTPTITFLTAFSLPRKLQSSFQLSYEHRSTSHHHVIQFSSKNILGLSLLLRSRAKLLSLASRVTPPGHVSIPRPSIHEHPSCITKSSSSSRPFISEKSYCRVVSRILALDRKTVSVPNSLYRYPCIQGTCS